jgi:hypothetical protein
MRGGCTIAGAQTSLVVPSGVTILIKEVLVYNANPAATNVQLYIWAPSESFFPRLFQVTINPAATYLWSGWAALQPGDSAQFVSTMASVHYWVSGSVLEGDNLFEPVVGTSAAPGDPSLLGAFP